MTAQTKRDMNLDQVRAIREDATHYIVDHEKRGAFRLSKADLPDDVQSTIRSVMRGKAAAEEALKNEAGDDGVVRAAYGTVTPDMVTEAVAPTEEEQRLQSLVDATQAHLDSLPETQQSAQAAQAAEDARVRADIAQRRQAARLAAINEDPGVASALDLRASQQDRFPTSSGTPQAEVPQAEVPQAEVPQAEVPQADVPQAEVPQAGVPESSGLMRALRSGLLGSVPEPTNPYSLIGKAGEDSPESPYSIRASDLPATQDPSTYSMQLGREPGQGAAPSATVPASGAEPSQTPPVSATQPSGTRQTSKSYQTSTSSSGAPVGAAKPLAGFTDTYNPNQVARIRQERQAAFDLKSRIEDEAQLARDAVGSALENKLGELQQANDRSKAALTARLTRLQEEAADPLVAKDLGFLGVIGVALGAFGSGLAGGPNFALQILNKRIDDDLRTQIENRNNKRTRIGDLQQQGLSLDNALKLAKAEATAKAAGTLDATLKRLGTDPRAKAAGLFEARAKMQEDALKLNDELHKSHLELSAAPLLTASKLETDRLNQMETRQKMRLAASTASNTTTEDDLKRQKAQLEIDKLKREDAEGKIAYPAMAPSGALLRDARGNLVQEPPTYADPETRKEVRPRLLLLSAVQQMRNTLNQDLSNFSPADRARYDADLFNLFARVKASTAGMSSDSDAKKIMSALPDNWWTSGMTGSNKASLDALEAAAAADISALRGQNPR